MQSRIRLTVVCFLLASWCLAAEETRETIKDRADFLPKQKHQELGAKVIGVLVSDPQPLLSTEGRFGPAERICFSADGNSYRWIYAPVKGKAQITNLKVAVGGGKTKMYPMLNLAGLEELKPHGVKAAYHLVEVEVNDGLGSPAEEGFVATKVTVLDGGKDFPLKVADLVADMKKKYDKYLKEEDKAIRASMEKAQKKAIEDRKPTGPRERNTLMFVTWINETQRLQVRFQTKISDGDFRMMEGGGIRPIDPVRPLRGPAPPPPPPREKIKVGTGFGVELGLIYEISKDGKLDKTRVLPIEGFHFELEPPPAAAGQGFTFWTAGDRT